jgi:hypothetical protein
MENVTFLGRREAAQWLTERGFKTAARSLEKLACAGGGPAYRTFGRRALYAPADLLAWAESRLGAPRKHTSEGRANAA